MWFAINMLNNLVKNAYIMTNNKAIPLGIIESKGNSPGTDWF